MKIPVVLVGGVVLIFLGVRDLRSGSSNPFIIRGHYWDRDEHPWLFWISVLSWIIAGVFLIGFQFWLWISH